MSTLDELLLNGQSSASADGATQQDVWMRTLTGSAAQATRASNAVPTGSDFAYFMQTSEEFKTEVTYAQEDIEHLLRRINSFAHSSSSSSSGDCLQYEDMQSLIESLLERADLCLDKVKSGVDAANASPAIKTKFTSGGSGIGNTWDLESTETLEKPQLAFLHSIDNSRHSPFKPRITAKHHSRTPLVLKEVPVPGAGVTGGSGAGIGGAGEEEEEEEEEEFINADTALKGDGPSTYYDHPYAVELTKLVYPEWQLLDASYAVSSSSSNSAKEIARLVNDSKHPFMFVDTTEQLEQAVNEMCSFKEIAVDVEHHSIRSFQGLTCLLQISTREKDYIIDTLVLRKSSVNKQRQRGGGGKAGTGAHLSYVNDLYLLNEVFCDPGIVKVFHGCARDIMWLQRDCGIYVVNCFDTYQAGAELKLPSLSLAYLLDNYVHVRAQKQYQQADWRQRPLPKELIKYAKDDTHYLLYIYDCLRRDLWKAVGLEGYKAVLDRSKETCLGRYEKQQFLPLGYRHLIKRRGRVHGQADLTATQETALSALWSWRDSTARATDESVTYILSTSELLRIARQTPLTTTAFKRVFPNAPARLACWESEIVAVLSGEFAIGGAVAVRIAVDTQKAANKKPNAPLHTHFPAAEAEAAEAKATPKQTQTKLNLRATITYPTPGAQALASVFRCYPVPIFSPAGVAPTPAFTPATGSSSKGVTAEEKYSFSYMCNPQATKDWFGPEFSLNVPGNTKHKVKTIATGNGIAAADSTAERIKRAQAAILGLVGDAACTSDRTLLSNAATATAATASSGAAEQAPTLFSTESESSGTSSSSTNNNKTSVSVQDAEQAALIASMGPIIVEEVQDELANRKRKIGDMHNKEIPEELAGNVSGSGAAIKRVDKDGIELVNLKPQTHKKVKKSHSGSSSVGGAGNSGKDMHYMKSTASHAAKHGSESAAPATTSDGAVDYSSISTEMLGLVGAISGRATDLETDQKAAYKEKREKEKEKKRKMKEALSAAANSNTATGAGGFGRNGKKANPYFTAPETLGKEKVPDRDHNRLYTFQ